MSANPWGHTNVVAGLIQEDSRGVSWIALRDKDIPEAYWKDHQAAWMVDGVSPRFNDGACVKGLNSGRLVWLPYAVYLTLRASLGPEYGEVCL